jgi:hypothetical protein
MSAWDVVAEMVGVEGEGVEGVGIGGLTICAMAGGRRRKAGSSQDLRTVRNDIVAGENFNRYDFIVDDDGTLCRVQVKSAHRAGANGGYSIRTHGHSGRSYEASEIDALAAWVAPEDAWYLFPVRVVRRLRTMKLFPASRRKRSKFEKWREAWWVVSRRLKRMV